MLYWGTFILALGNGTVEAVINPAVATIYPKEKTKWLNILHAGWPAGLVLGLSKFHRIVEWASQGLKLQEEVTQLIGRELTEVLGPNSQVQVEVRAYHTCAITRGVKADSDFEYLTGYFNNAPD